MSAPLIWVVFPVLLGVVLWFVQRRTMLAVGLAVGACLLLAILAWQLPIGGMLTLGSASIKIDSALNVLGRRFVLTAGDRYFLMLTYLIGAMWFFASHIAKTRSVFLPLGMVLLALIVAAQAIEPFLFAALLIGIGVLLSVPLLISRDSAENQGVLRFVVFQIMALPFILLAGWASGVVEVNPSASNLLTQATLLLAFGFAFWLGVFPFNTWIGALLSKAHPFTGSFLFTVLFSANAYLVISFLDSFAWLRVDPIVPMLFLVGGTATVVTGGIWAGFERDLKRLMGFGFIIENGFLLVALSLEQPLGVQIFTVSLVPRIMSFALMGLALSILERNRQALTFDQLAGVIKQFPVTSIAILIAYFSMGGFPLLAGFPGRQVLFEQLGQQAGIAAIWLFVGNIGFLLGGVRLIISMLGEMEKDEARESKTEKVLLSIGVAVLVAIGLAPTVFLPIWLNLSQVFERMK